MREPLSRGARYWRERAANARALAEQTSNEELRLPPMSLDRALLIISMCLTAAAIVLVASAF